MAQNQNYNNQSLNHDNPEKDLLQEIWGGKTAVKIYQALEIGKIKFSFFKKEAPSTDSIDVYMDAVDFASDFIDIINSGELLNRLTHEKKRMAETKEEYGKELWTSRAGITGSDKDQIRRFSIQPGTKTELAFRATQGKSYISVGFDFRELKNLAYKWSFLEDDWNKIMASRYNLSSMASEYHTKKNREQYEVQQREESIPPESYIDDEDISYIPIPLSATKSADNEIDCEPSRNAIPMKSIVLKVKTPLTDASGERKAFQGWSEDNNLYSVVIRKELVESGDASIRRLLKEAETVGNKLTVYGGIKDRVIYVA